MNMPFRLTSRLLRYASAPAMLAVAGLVAGTVVAGETRDASSRGWTCELCPKPDGWSGEVDAGSGWVSDSSPRFGDYRGLERAGGFAAVDGVVRFRGEGGRFADLQARDLGVDSRQALLRAGVRGKYVVEFDYLEIPKYRGFGAETVYLGSGGNRLTLPPDWEPAATTDGMGALADSLRPAVLDMRRKVTGLSVRSWLGSGWSIDFGVENQRKEGTRPFGAGVFTVHSSHFPAPVDFSTNRLETGLSFASTGLNWRLGLSGSEFDNGYPSITWPNPFTPIPGTEMLRASLEPDNRFRQLEFAGAWAASNRLRFSAAAAVGRMEQDEPLLPASSNPDFGDIALPRDTADARIDLGTLNLAAKADLKLSPRLTMTARLRRDERDNRTPVDLFDPVITDIVLREARPNRPYSFERDRASLALRYRASHTVRLQAGLDFEDHERSLQSVRETEQRGYWVDGSWAAGPFLAIRARMERSDRDAGPYLLLDDGGPIENPLMRKFHLADRERERWKLEIDFSLRPELTAVISLHSGRDDYARSVIGLLDAEDRSLSLDLGWSISDRLSLHGFASRDDIESRMASAEASPGPLWSGTTRDRFHTAGAGLRYSTGPRSRAGFDLVWAESEGDIATVSEGAGGAFPSVRTELWNARLYAEHELTARWGIKARLEYESYDSSDWALDAIGPAGIPAILSFGQESPDDEVFVLRLQARYRF